MSIRLYKIRRKSDLKYSTGGCKPVFNKAGKTWSLQTLRSHLRQHQTRNFADYKDCELVIFEEIAPDITFEEIIKPYQDDEIMRRLSKSN